MNNLIYCIKHEKIVELEPVTIKSHSWMSFMGSNEEVPEYDNCKFPLGYAFCSPPPSLFEDVGYMIYSAWEKWCKNTQPSPEEIKASNLKAIELLEDLEGVL